jgi:hypothetical protein
MLFDRGPTDHGVNSAGVFLKQLRVPRPTRSRPIAARRRVRIALGVWQIGLFALPLLMTGEKVRDIGDGEGLGQWAQQEVNGLRDLEGGRRR